eukprot:IDg11172t1
MAPERVSRTAHALRAQRDSAVVLGGNFARIPHGSTPRYEAFHRMLTPEHARSLVFAFRDAPLAMPTLACTRAAWRAARAFKEGRGVPEDLHFVYDAMQGGAALVKLGGAPLTLYRYHAQMVSHAYTRLQLLRIRVKAFENIVLARQRWRGGFAVWGAGRDGKEFFKCLSEDSKRLVRCWGDVDPKKIGKTLRGRPVLHFSKLTPPIALCVAMDRGGAFERNLATLALTGGVDYFHIA